MKPEEQCEAIAEACGWRSFSYAVINGIRKDEKTWLSGEELTLGFTPDDMPSGTYAGRYVPDYINDLNAMHEVEKVIPRDKIKKYTSTLIGLSGRAWNADAPQRAEAFLRCLNLWKDSK